MSGCPVHGVGGPADPGRRNVLLSGLSGLVGAAGLAGVGVTAGCTGSADGAETTAAAAAQAAEGARATRPFRGPRQSGIVDAPQAYADFVALDLAPGADLKALRGLLTVWTDDIERLVSGRPPLTDMDAELATVPASLTVTLAVGPRVVALADAQAPKWLRPLPAFSIDKLSTSWGPSDLLLQIAANSPTTVSHAARRLVTAGGGIVVPRWVQRGFREPYEGPGLPMRNLFGQVDGTVQPALDGPDDGILFVDASAGPSWLVGGSALVIRRIAMDLTVWDRVDRVDRENAIGRRLETGAPLTAAEGADASAAADLTATDALGFTVIDTAAHMRRARPEQPHERFLRRPYSYDVPSPSGVGTDVGLIFAAYMADPVRQFVPVQQRLAETDLLNLWTTPIGSGVWAVLPGAREGEILGQALLKA